MREPCRAAVHTAARAPAGLPATARDGEPRQARDTRWRSGRRVDRRRDLGRAGLECAAFLLPAPAPGHGLGERGLPAAHHRRGRSRGRRARHRELPGTDPGVDGGSRIGRTPSRASGQPAAVAPGVPAPRPGDARVAPCALRAQGFRRFGPVGHQSVRPMGRRARQEDLLEPCCRLRRRNRPPNSQALRPGSQAAADSGPSCAHRAATTTMPGSFLPIGSCAYISFQSSDAKCVAGRCMSRRHSRPRAGAARRSLDLSGRRAAAP